MLELSAESSVGILVLCKKNYSACVAVKAVHNKHASIHFVEKISKIRKIRIEMVGDREKRSRLIHHQDVIIFKKKIDMISASHNVLFGKWNRYTLSTTTKTRSIC